MESKSGAAPSVLANSLAKTLVAGVVVTNLIVAGLICFSLYKSRLHYFESASISSRNISQQLDDNITGLFAKVDNTLRFVSGEVEHQLASGRIDKESADAFIRQAISHLPEVSAIRVTDSSGQVILGPDENSGRKRNLAHTDCFSTLRTSPGAGLVFSKPFTCGFTGRRMIILARRINRPDGSFAGIVSAGISKDSLLHMFSKLDVGRHGSISLYGADFQLVARHSQHKVGALVEPHIIRIKPFLDLAQAGRKAGTYSAKSGIDSLYRTVSFRKLDSPFYVFAGAAYQDFLAPWRVEVTRMCIFMALFLAATFLLTWQFLRSWRRCRETEQAASAALQESEARFETMLMSVPSVAVQGYDPTGRTLYWNQASEKLYGYSAEEALGQSLVDLIIPPPMREDVVQAIRHMAETGEPIPASELELMRKDGSLVPVFSSHVIVKMPGREQELFCLDVDLSERKKVEEELHQNRHLLQAVIEGTTDAVYVKDTDGRYLLFNSSACRLTGKSADDVIGRDDFAIFSPEEARRVMAADKSVMEMGQTMTFEDTVTDAQGEKRAFLTTKGPLYSPSGSIIGSFGISRDVTEEKAWGQKILQLNETLDERVRQRTSELESALREQEAFSYSVSHDLRSPLRAVNGYLAVLMEDFGECLPAEAQPYLKRSREASVTMGKLIDDLLELARVSRAELVKGDVNLSDLAVEIVSALQQQEPDREVEIVVEEGVSARCDKVLLRLVLENLLGNAWKYSSRERTFRLEFGRKEACGENVFFVKDNGIGFEMQYHDKVFGVFQRLHRQEYEGTGIGLATVKRIVERHGGSVWAESELGIGATFFLKFP